MQTVAGAVFTLLGRERLWLAALDLVCVCGFVTAAVMDRALTDRYRCHAWLTRDGGNHNASSLIARAAAAETEAESGFGPETAECVPLRGLFGIAISQWFACLSFLSWPPHCLTKADHWAWGQCDVGDQLPAGLSCPAGAQDGPGG